MAEGKASREHRLILPWPPSVNTYWRTFRGRMLISKAGRDYRDAVADTIGSGIQFGSSRLAITLTAYPPDRRKRDLDNMLKAPLDALTKAAVWDDDSQIDVLTITRGEIRPGGCLVVEVKAMV